MNVMLTRGVRSCFTERLADTERHLDVSKGHSLRAADKTDELKQLNRSIFRPVITFNKDKKRAAQEAERGALRCVGGGRLRLHVVGGGAGYCLLPWRRDGPWLVLGRTGAWRKRRDAGTEDWRAGARPCGRR